MSGLAVGNTRYEKSACHAVIVSSSPRIFIEQSFCTAGWHLTTAKGDNDRSHERAAHMTFRLIPGTDVAGEDIDVGALTLHALRSIANKPCGVVASFRDDEGDECVVSCAQELEEARLIATAMRPAPLILRLHPDPKPVLARAISTAPPRACTTHGKGQLGSALPYYWLPAAVSDCGDARAQSASSAVDVHAAFRITFCTSQANTTVVIRHVALSWYNLWVDGTRVAEGPTRFIGDTPFYDTSRVAIPSAGVHVIAIHAHSAGVQTRMLLEQPPVVACDVQSVDPIARPLSAAPTWRCQSLQSWYKAEWARLSVLLGWACNVAVEEEQQRWHDPAYDDSAWAQPSDVTDSCGLKSATALSDVAEAATSEPGTLTLLAAGQLYERHGYAEDEPAARFRLRQLVSNSHDGGNDRGDGCDFGPAQGLWWRYDAGRCRLLRAVLCVSAPAGTVFEVCYCQALIDGKASPYHPLTGGKTCYIDRFTIGSSVAGKQVMILPLEPRGGRYIEVHAVCDDAPDNLASVALIEASALFRGYGPYQRDPVGRFACSTDALLDRIWLCGAETTRSCVEDTAVDGPCRERGEWTGDTLAVTLPNLVSMYDDISPIRLALLQSSQACDAHGVFSGNCPEVTYPMDYALIWFEGALAYFQATGDVATMSLLLPRAKTCMDYLLSTACYGETGFAPKGYGLVVDWGYKDNEAFPVNMCLNALLISALSALVAWADALGDAAAHATYSTALKQHAQLVAGAVLPTAGDFDPSRLGFHAAVFVLRAGVLDGDAHTPQREACCDFIEARLRACFPIDTSAPRLSDPAKRSASGFYTPYFQTFTFDGMLRAGRADFVLEQYRAAWGWALTQANTWLEVFDPRWEAVHSWGGCPTWQMTRFLLGLQPRFDVGARHFDLDLHVGTELPGCAGAVPARGGGAIGVAWKRSGAAAAGQLQLTLTIGDTSCFIRGWPGATTTDTWTELKGTVTIVVPDAK